MVDAHITKVKKIGAYYTANEIRIEFDKYVNISFNYYKIIKNYKFKCILFYKRKGNTKCCTIQFHIAFFYIAIGN